MSKPIKQKSVESKDAEESFNGWKEYMTAKKSKLSEQFKGDASSAGESSHGRSLFSGVSISVNGYTNPSCDELKRVVLANGGQYHIYATESTTHVIASNLPHAKLCRLKIADRIVRPEWIMDSLAAGRLLPERDYLLMRAENLDKFSAAAAIPETRSNASSDVVASTSKQSVSKGTIPSANDPNFLSEFYKKSRLHFLSSWGQEMKKFVQQIRQTSDGSFKGRERLKVITAKSGDDSQQSTQNDDVTFSSQPYVMHLDMDCFFVSISLQHRPELADEPVAVSHSTARGRPDEKKSFAEVASCNYVARRFGVRNGMLLGDALLLCPTLKIVPYDFDRYHAASKTFYEIVTSFTLDVEPISCDEMFVDLEGLCRSLVCQPVHVADCLRREIRDQIGCTASAGIGPNKLVARLATRKAKPDGVFVVASDAVTEFMKDCLLSDLPGVGWHTLEKLQGFGATTCGDLANVDLSKLQKHFGAKRGKQLYEFVRGIDWRAVVADPGAKSVSCDVNYGIRFASASEAESFLLRLSEELHNRMRAIQKSARCITLKLMIRSPSAPVKTMKFMGHGQCDVVSRSCTVSSPMSTASAIYEKCLSLMRQLKPAPQDLRGVGISVKQLEPLEATGTNRKGIMECFQRSSLHEEQKVSKEGDDGTKLEVCLLSTRQDKQLQSTLLINKDFITKPRIQTKKLISEDVGSGDRASRDSGSVTTKDAERLIRALLRKGQGFSDSEKRDFMKSVVECLEHMNLVKIQKILYLLRLSFLKHRGDAKKMSNELINDVQREVIKYYGCPMRIL